MQCENLTTLNLNGMDKLKAIHPALMNLPSLKRIHAYQNSRLGTLNPALPNTKVTTEKYEGSIVYWGRRYPIEERLSKHESKWRQQAYLRQRWMGKDVWIQSCGLISNYRASSAPSSSCSYKPQEQKKCIETDSDPVRLRMGEYNGH